MTHTVLRGNAVMERKKVSISAKRQITIPQKFFAMLGFDDEAECILRGNELVIRPVKESSGDEFAEQILTDLVKRGLSGDELIKAFKAEQKKVRPAVEEMLAEAKNAADGNAEYLTYNDVFGTEE